MATPTAPWLPTLQTVEEQFICTICTETLQEPKLLGCGHSLCRHCLQDWINHQHDRKHAVSCPTCKQVTHVPDTTKRQDDWASQFTTNFHLISVMDTLLPKEPMVIVCSVCSSRHEKQLVPAKLHCKVCQENYCDKCADTHRLLIATKEHDLVPHGRQVTEHTCNVAEQSWRGKKLCIQQKATFSKTPDDDFQTGAEIKAVAFSYNFCFLLRESREDGMYNHYISVFDCDNLKVLHTEEIDNSLVIEYAKCSIAASEENILLVAKGHMISKRSARSNLFRSKYRNLFRKIGETSIPEICKGISFLNPRRFLVCCEGENNMTALKIYDVLFKPLRVVTLSCDFRPLEAHITEYNNKVFIVFKDECVKCLSMEGEVKWERFFLGGAPSGMVVNDDIVLIALANEHRVVQIDAESGEEIQTVVDRKDAIDFPYGLAADPRRNRLIVLDKTNTVRMFSFLPFLSSPKTSSCSLF